MTKASELSAALSAARLPNDVLDVSETPLTGGRTGAGVYRLSARFADGASRTYVQKVLEAHTWRDDAMESAAGGEAALFEAGVLATPPPPLSASMFHVDRTASGAYRMWMHDVSAGIRPRGEFSDADEVRLAHAVASLHASYWESPALEVLPLATIAGTTRVFAEPAAALARGEAAVQTSAPWVRRFLAEFTPLGGLLPRMLELLAPEDADFYIDLCTDRAWLAGLDGCPVTLVHGDLRRANISFGEDSSLSLIDWEFAARGSAATDLAWHCFLHFWAYAPDARDARAREDAFHASYLHALEAALGAAVDPALFARARNTAWLRIIAQLGFLLGDHDELSQDDPRMVAQRALAARAITRARAIRDEAA